MSKENDRILKPRPTKVSLPPRTTLPSTRSRSSKSPNPFLRNLSESRDKEEEDFAIPEPAQKHYWTKEEVI